MSDSNSVLSQYTAVPGNLFALLSRYRVAIPGIQRHYVQGADNPRAKDVRANFIRALFAAFTCPQGKLHLHFVYGPIDTNGEDTFTPVDGQQRLTTLWLLARYAAEQIEDGADKSAVLKLLSKFSYTDRIHATRFCQALTRDGSSWPKAADPQCAIPLQDWFLDYWKQDETVSSMLRMLSTIHEQWTEKEVDAKNMLEFLASRATFSLQIDNFADDIYMKMNARGLQLTQWENFKGKFAELLSEEPEKGARKEWNEQIEQLSNDYFERSGEQLPDDAFFALAARLAVYEVGVQTAQAKNDESEEVEKPNIGKQIKALSSFTQWGGELPFVPFSEFEEVLPEGARDEFARDYMTLINVILRDDIVRMPSPYWQTERIIRQSVFEPKNQNELDLSWLLFAYCKKYSRGGVLTENFARALRCVWNILENVERDSDSKKELERLLLFNNSFIQKCGPSLYAKVEESVTGEANQWQEERVKACIYADNENIAALQTAECYLHGRVRLAILNLKDKTPCINWGRINKLNALFEAWATGDDARKIIVMNIVAAEPYKLIDAIEISTNDKTLRALLTTRNDSKLQDHLDENIGSSGIPETPFSDACEGGGELPKWARDWRAVLLKIARGEDGYDCYQTSLWDRRVRWHHSGFYALYCMKTIKNALPINDWRIELGLNNNELGKWFKKFGDEFKDVSCNDYETHSGRIEINGRKMHLYFWKDKVAFVHDAVECPNHCVNVEVGEASDVPRAVNEALEKDSPQA